MTLKRKRSRARRRRYRAIRIWFKTWCLESYKETCDGSDKLREQLNLLGKPLGLADESLDFRRTEVEVTATEEQKARGDCSVGVTIGASTEDDHTDARDGEE